MRVYADNWPRSLILEIGPDSKDTPERERDFYCERTPTGRTSLPKMPRKNDLYKMVMRGRTPSKIITDTHRHFRRLISYACFHLEACVQPVRLVLEQVYGRKREIAGLTYPAMDSDACLSAVRDAIQTPKKIEPYMHPRFGGLLLDDGQIVQNEATARYVKDVYSLRIEIQAMPHWEG